MRQHQRLPYAIAFASTRYKGAKDVMSFLQQCQRKLDVMAQAAVSTGHLSIRKPHPHPHGWDSQ